MEDFHKLFLKGEVEGAATLRAFRFSNISGLSNNVLGRVYFSPLVLTTLILVFFLPSDNMLLTLKVMKD